MMKKLLVILLLCALTLGLLSGCAGTAAPETEPSGEPQTVQTEAADAKKLQFTTTDLSGATVTLSDFADAKLILVNFWEPWCGPCVGELPDLAALYEKYKDQGLVILGVFGDMEEEAISLVEQNGIGYPILHLNGDFSDCTTAYVPTTVLIRGDGTVLTDDPLIGARDYDAWEAIILSCLED